MMRPIAYILIALMKNIIDTPLSLDVAVQSNEIFANNLFKNVDNKDTNIVMSPLSAQLITEFLRLGSDGNTAKQIKKALNLPESGLGNGFKLLIDELKKEPNATIRIANRVYVSNTNSLDNDFQNVTQEMLLADAVNVDFYKEKTTNEINKWVEQKTENKIKDLITPGSLTRDTSLLLVNTLYFKGLWELPFDHEYRKIFHKHSNKNVETDFLAMKTKSGYDIKGNELPELSARMVDIPYKGRKLRFVIILPDKNTTLESLEKKMSDIKLHDLLNTTVVTDNWKISIPKFKIETSLDLKDTFKKMGMTDMFMDGIADFSKMTNSNYPGLYVTDVKQKTVIEINQLGTEAASGTFGSLGFLIGDMNPPFIADRPFLFYIIHKTTENHSTVLFSGRFTSPANDSFKFVKKEKSD